MTDREDTVTLDVRQYMDYGLDVYDAASKKVGSIDYYDNATGYMMVRSNPFSERDLYIPYSAITNIDPRDVFVSKAKDELHRRYGNPPPRSVFVKRRIDRDTGEDDTRAVTSEPSGYDGSQTILGAADVGHLAHHIAPGFHVYTSEMESVGPIKRYDRGTGEMVVGRGLGSEPSIIPVALVASVDRDGRKVFLAVSAEDLHRLQKRNPNDPVIVETDVTESTP